MSSRSSSSSSDLLGPAGDNDYLLSSPTKPSTGRPQRFMSPSTFKLMQTPGSVRGRSFSPTKSTPKSAHSIRFDDVLLPTSPGGKKLNAGRQRSLSPNKGQLDGSSSPWRIRVTLEATQDGEDEENQGLNPFRQLLGNATTMTTKVPLKDERDQAESSPRKRRGRPRKSDVQPTPSKTPAASPGNTPGAKSTQGQGKKRGRPRKSPHPSIETEAGNERSSPMPEQPTPVPQQSPVPEQPTPVPEPSSPLPEQQSSPASEPPTPFPDQSTSFFEPEQGRDSPLDLAAGGDSEDDDLPGSVSNDPFPAEDLEGDNEVEQPDTNWSRSSPRVTFAEPTFDTPDVSAVDRDYDDTRLHSTPSRMPSDARQPVVSSPANALHAGRTPRPPTRLYPTPTSSSLAGEEDQETGDVVDEEPEDELEQIQELPVSDPTNEHREFDSIVESEGFSMVSLDTLPSAKQQEIITHSERAKGALKPFYERETTRAAEGPAKRKASSLSTTIYGDDPGTAPELDPEASGEPPRKRQSRSPERPLSSGGKSFQQSMLLSPPGEVTAPSPVENRRRPFSRLARIVRAGVALEGTLRQNHGPDVWPDENYDFDTPRKRLEHIFSDLDYDTQKELRAGLGLGQEIAMRKTQIETMRAEREEAARVAAEQEEITRQQAHEEMERARREKEARRVAQQEKARRKAEAERERAAQEEAEREAAEQEYIRRKAQADRLRAEQEEAAREAAEEEEAARRAAEHDRMRRRAQMERERAAQEEADREAAEQERIRREAQADRERAEQEEAEREAAAEERARKRALAEIQRAEQEEEEAARAVAEQERARKRMQAERQRIEQEDAAREAAEQEEAAWQAAEQERARRRALAEIERAEQEEEQAAREAAELEQMRLAQAERQREQRQRAERERAEREVEQAAIEAAELEQIRKAQNMERERAERERAAQEEAYNKALEDFKAMRRAEVESERAKQEEASRRAAEQERARKAQAEIERAELEAARLAAEQDVYDQDENEAEEEEEDISRTPQWKQDRTSRRSPGRTPPPGRTPLGRIPLGQTSQGRTPQSEQGRTPFRDTPGSDMRRRMAEWQREREAISREIEQANSSQVIVINSDEARQTQDDDDDDDDDVQGIEAEFNPGSDGNVPLNLGDAAGDDESEDYEDEELQDADQEDELQEQEEGEDEEEEGEDDDVDIWQQEAQEPSQMSHHSSTRHNEAPSESASSPWKGSAPSEYENSYSPAHWTHDKERVPYLGGHSRVQQLREQEVDFSSLLRAENTPNHSRYYYGNSSPQSSANGRSSQRAWSNTRSPEKFAGNAYGQQMPSEIGLESSPHRPSDDDAFQIDPTTRIEHERLRFDRQPRERDEEEEEEDEDGDYSEAAATEERSIDGQVDMTPQSSRNANPDVQGSTWFQRLVSLTPGWLRAPTTAKSPTQTLPSQRRVSGAADGEHVTDDGFEENASASSSAGYSNEVDPEQVEGHDMEKAFRASRRFSEWRQQDEPQTSPDSRAGQRYSPPGNGVRYESRPAAATTAAPAHPRAAPAAGLAVSGYFTDEHYAVLRRLYRLAQRFPDRFAYYPAPGRAEIIGDWIWTSDGRYGVPVMEGQFAVIDRFVRDLTTSNVQSGGTGQIGWTEADLHRRLISVIIGERIRGERKASMPESEL